VPLKNGDQMRVPSQRYKPQIVTRSTADIGSIVSTTLLDGYIFGGYDTTGELDDLWKVTVNVSACIHGKEANGTCKTKGKIIIVSFSFNVLSYCFLRYHVLMTNFEFDIN
jgi:hypothetical protein